MEQGERSKGSEATETRDAEQGGRNRYKSWALWVSVAGAVWTILAAFGVPEKIGLTSETFQTVLNAIGAMLIAFGILNNPTDKEHF